jgi:hypothetical protein
MAWTLAEKYPDGIVFSNVQVIREVNPHPRRVERLYPRFRRVTMKQLEENSTKITLDGSGTTSMELKPLPPLSGEYGIDEPIRLSSVATALASPA